MNDVLKKRVIGVVVLIVVAVLATVLLSRCVGHSSQPGGQGKMRVYNVQPNGQAVPATQGNSAPTGASNAAGQGENTMSGADNAAPNNGQFTTPPVHGGNGAQQQVTQPSENQAPQQSTPSSSVTSAQQTPSQPQTPPEQVPSQPKIVHRHEQPQHETHRSESSSASHTSHEHSAPTHTSHTSPSHQSTSASSSETTHSGLERGQISGWVVQVGAFSKESNAQALARRLSGNFSASYTPAEIKGQRLYIVNVGPLPNKSAAESVESRLKQQGQSALVRDLP